MIDAPLDNSVNPAYLMQAIELLSPANAGFNAPTLEEIKEAQDFVSMLDNYLAIAEPQIQILEKGLDISNLDLTSLNKQQIEFLRNATKLFSLVVNPQTEIDIKAIADKWASTHKASIANRVHRLLAVLTMLDDVMMSLSDKIIETYGDDVHYDVNELKASLNSDVITIPDDISFDDFDELMRA